MRRWEKMRRWVKLRSIPIFAESLVERNDREC